MLTLFQMCPLRPRFSSSLLLLLVVVAITTSLSASEDTEGSDQSHKISQNDVQISGNWKFENIHNRPTIEPDELYEMGGYLHLLQVNSVRLQFIESPIEYLNDQWSLRIMKAFDLERAKVVAHQVTDDDHFPCPFRSITFGFDYWISQSKNQTQPSPIDNSSDFVATKLDNSTAQESIAGNRSNLITNHILSMSVCGQTHQEQLQANQWMYAAVRLNMEHMTFRRFNQLIDCVGSIFAHVKCDQVTFHQDGSKNGKCLINNIAFKNVEVVYEYKEEEEEGEGKDDHPDGKIDIHEFDQENPPHLQLKTDHRDRIKPSLERISAGRIRKNFATNNSFTKVKLTSFTSLRRPMDLLFHCHYDECSSFQLNQNSISSEQWQGVQWAPFIPGQLEEYIGTDQSDAWLKISLLSSSNWTDPRSKCFSFQYYVAAFSRIQVSFKLTGNGLVWFQPTLRRDNKDKRNWSHEWYDGELCLSDFLTPDMLKVERLLGNESLQLFFKALQPKSGGYAALAGLRVLDDFQRAPFQSNRQVLTGWNWNGATAAEQWTSCPADARWIQPELIGNELNILFHKPILIGQSGYSLLSAWFVRQPEQRLRFSLRNNFTNARMEVLLFDSKYAVRWTSGTKVLRPGKTKTDWLFDLDAQCDWKNCDNRNTNKTMWFAEQKNNRSIDQSIVVDDDNSCCSHQGQYLRWSLLFSYENLYSSTSETETLEIFDLDQSDACAQPETSCTSHGQCEALVPNQRICECQTGYHGPRCEYRDQCVLPLSTQLSGNEQCAQSQAAGCQPIGSQFRCQCSSSSSRLTNLDDTTTTTTDSGDKSHEWRFWSEERRQCVSASNCSRTLCTDPLHQCVQRNGQAVCECLPGYEVRNSATGQQCKPKDPCLSRRHPCPAGAKCISTTGGVSLAAFVATGGNANGETFCYCDPLDGLQPVPATNAVGFTCQPLLDNPFVKQSHNCYMTYERDSPKSMVGETNSTTIENNNKVSLTFSRHRPRRWIVGGQNEDEFDFEKEDSRSSSADPIEQQWQSSLANGLSTTKAAAISDQLIQNETTVRCSCLPGFIAKGSACFPVSVHSPADCDPYCGPTEHCVQHSISNHSFECTCQLGFTGNGCRQSFCEPEVGGNQLRHLCGQSGCHIGISASQLNWFACNCNVEDDDLDLEIRNTETGNGGYRNHPVSGLCVQRPVCLANSDEQIRCKQIGGVCVARQSNDDGSLYGECVCPLGFGWNFAQDRCVELCQLDTHCAPVNAVCQSLPQANTTRCVCPVGRRWDPLRAACFLTGSRNSVVYELSSTFLLINDAAIAPVHESAVLMAATGVDCSRNLDPIGCAAQLGSARRRLSTAVNICLSTEQLLSAWLVDTWTNSLRAVFGADLQQINVFQVEWKDEIEFGGKESIISSMFYKPIQIKLLIDCAGWLNWTEQDWLVGACLPLVNETVVNPHQSWCALPPRILLQPDSTRLRSVQLCQEAESLHLCPRHSRVRCSSDEPKRFGCECMDGFRSTIQLAQEPEGPLQIQFCVDVDECEQADNSMDNRSVCDSSTSRCVNLVGSYRCDCLPGFRSLNTTTCVDICLGVDCHGGRCEGYENGFFCTCPPGFGGIYCEQPLESKLFFLFVYSCSITLILLVIIVVGLAYLYRRIRGKYHPEMFTNGNAATSLSSQPPAQQQY